MINRLKRIGESSAPQFGVWVTLESPNVTEAIVALGLDWALIDMEHGHLTWGDVVGHLRVLSARGVPGLVRVPDLTRESLQRALDIGADGVVVPMIGRREQLELAFQYGKYPPRGVRGVGGERCVRWGLETLDYVRSANTDSLIIPLLETREAVENHAAILEVPGLEGVWFGPADMSSSFGCFGQWDEGPVAEAILTICQAASAKGISSGIMAKDSREARVRQAQGFQWITVGTDINLMMNSIRGFQSAWQAPD